MLSITYMLFAPTDNRTHAKLNNHVKYCLHAFRAYRSPKAKCCLHSFRAYMTESIQSEIVMLSIAYMLFAPTDNRKAYKAK